LAMLRDFSMRRRQVLGSGRVACLIVCGVRCGGLRGRESLRGLYFEVLRASSSEAPRMTASPDWRAST
jgi:hypothetical protein